MRNLRKHPLQFEEVLSIMTDLAVQLENEKNYGDLRPLALRAAVTMLRRVQFVTWKAGV